MSTRARTTILHPDLMAVDRSLPEPLQQQIYRMMRRLILERRLEAGRFLPSTRELADHLGVGRNTVIAAYDQLLAEGFVDARTGSGTRVAEIGESRTALGDAPAGMAAPGLSARGELIAAAPQPARPTGVLNLHPGRPETGEFPFSTWGTLVTRHARSRDETLMSYSAFAGHEGLRRVIAEKVCPARGIACEPEQVIVVTGAQAALDLLARVLVDPGDVVWMEEPGYRGARSAFAAGGARLQPLTVDRAAGWGLIDTALSPPRLVYVTPACHWPLGSTMRIEERLQLIEIAAEQGAWIVEDDYDGEYRLRGTPVPALHGLDGTGHTIYVGSFGKTMLSGLRIGYLVVPRGLAGAFEHVVSISGHFAPLVLQAALADFIAGGYYARHLKRMRRLYARRQMRFAELARGRLSRFLDLVVSDSGMQLLGLFRIALDDAAFTEAAREAGLGVQGISITYGFSPPRHGLLLGYAALDDREAVRAVDTLDAVFRRLAG